MNRTRLAAAALVAAALAVAPATQARAHATTLKGVVGPGFTITLTNGGKKVTKLKAGAYVFKISDKSNIHNFHLKGPGVNKMTAVSETGSKTWKVTLKKGKYTFVCDPHATSMKGAFTVS